MPMPKSLIKQDKGKKKKEQILENADDFLAAGVEHEEAAGKWRAGDATKSLRFFSKAVDVYHQGLQKYPRSLDLAYNKARVQLEVATHPLLVKKLDVPVEIALDAALTSHRYALSLDQDNADTLFNTAQVLTTAAEIMVNDNKFDSQDVLKLLEEALEMQSRCLSIQEVKYEDSQRQEEVLMQPEQSTKGATNGDDSVGSTLDDNATTEDQWFSVVEPITQETLIDTLIAELSTLTTTCHVLSTASHPTSPSIPWIEAFAQSIISKKLPLLTSEMELPRQHEIRLTISKFTSAILEASFRHGGIDATTYKRARDGAFEINDTSQSYEYLLANAESLISFESAIADILPDIDSAAMRWQSLSSAITMLSTASKIKENSQDKTAKAHFLRGDCSLLQHQLGAHPLSYPQAVNNASQLLKNAEVFYMNGSKLFQEEDQRTIAALRSNLVAILRTNDTSGADALATPPRGQDWVRGQIQEMIDEGLLPSDFRL